MSGRQAKRARRERRPAERSPTRKRALVSAVAAALAVAAAVVALAIARVGGEGDTPPSAAPSEAAPAEVAAIAGTDPTTDRHVSLASYRGTPVVLNIWASWCTGCAAEARALAEFARTHPDAQVIGIDLQDTPGGAKEFYRRFGWTHPSIADPDGEIAFALRLQGLPTTIFLDRKHREVTRIVGETDLAGFTAGFRRANGS